MVDNRDPIDGFVSPELPLPADFEPLVYSPDVGRPARPKQSVAGSAQLPNKSWFPARSAALGATVGLAVLALALPEAHRSLLLGESRELAIPFMATWVLGCLLLPMVKRFGSGSTLTTAEVLGVSATFGGLAGLIYFLVLNSFENVLAHWSPDISLVLWVTSVLGVVVIVQAFGNWVHWLFFDWDFLHEGGPVARNAHFRLLLCAPVLGGIVAAAVLHSASAAAWGSSCFIVGSADLGSARGVLPSDCDSPSADHELESIVDSDVRCAGYLVDHGAAEASGDSASIGSSLSVLPGNRLACLVPSVVDADTFGVSAPWLASSREQSDGETVYLWSTATQVNPPTGFASVSTCAVELDGVPWIIVDGELRVSSSVSAHVPAGPIRTPQVVQTLGLLVSVDAERTAEGEWLATDVDWQSPMVPALLRPVGGQRGPSDSQSAALVAPGRSWRFGPLWFAGVNGVVVPATAGSGVERLSIRDRYPEILAEGGPFLMGVTWTTTEGNLIDLAFFNRWTYEEELCAREAPNGPPIR